MKPLTTFTRRLSEFGEDLARDGIRTVHQTAHSWLDTIDQVVADKVADGQVVVTAEALIKAERVAHLAINGVAAIASLSVEKYSEVRHELVGTTSPPLRDVMGPWDYADSLQNYADSLSGSFNTTHQTPTAA